ncbi:MAG: hypothetical protein WC872_00595 [Candidatus Absconditabacterales bacterium]
MPEILLDQIIGYTIGAKEMINGLTSKKDKKFNLAILPFGEGFYTGILQSAGYMLLKKSAKNLATIHIQNDNPKSININLNDILCSFGNSRKPQKNIQTLIKKYKFKSTHTTIANEIKTQTPFIDVLTETKEILDIGIGKEIQKETINNFLKFIKENKSDYNFVFLSNLNQKIDHKTGKKEDKQILLDLMNKKISDNVKNNFLLVYLFQESVKATKSQADIIAYSNSGDYGGNSKFTNGYGCVLG